MTELELGPNDGRVIGIVGAGTMGGGIAQVAALAGHPVRLFDSIPGAGAQMVSSIRTTVQRLTEAGKLRSLPKVFDLQSVDSLADLQSADVVIEAIVEDLPTKRELIRELDVLVPKECILASNSSSLSPMALATGLRHPSRVLGLHFFNPATRMPLVEVVSGLNTSPEIADDAANLMASWGKTVVRSAPTPGFIVNRVARPFYAEAWRLYEERAADPATIDAVFMASAGFRMGPFALMDLIGHDVNEAVTRQVWSSFNHDPRFEPSGAQRSLVEAGWIGRKAGRGVYDYSRDSQPPSSTPAEQVNAPSNVICHKASGFHTLLERTHINVVDGSANLGVELPSGVVLLRSNGTTATDAASRKGMPIVVVDRTLDDGTATGIAISRSDGCPEQGLQEAIGLLQAAGLAVYVLDDTPGLVVTRTVAMLVNVAVDAMAHGVASAADIDKAMRLGTNYPIGPLEWGDRWDPDFVCSVLTNLQAAYGDQRYRPSPTLRRRALSGQSLLPTGASEGVA